MGQIALQVPQSGQLNSTEDPKVASDFTALQTLVNGNIDTNNLSPTAAIAGTQLSGSAGILATQLDPTVAQKAGLNIPGQTVSGSTNIPGSQSTSSTSYTTLATPDQVTGITLSSSGLIAVWYQATWAETVSGAASAAIFLGLNQLQISKNQAANGPVVTFATTNGPAPNTNLSLFSFPGGLASTTANTNYSADVTTGQVVGASGGNSIPNTAVHDTIGGPCYIFAAAGTYTVSIGFKVTSGSVSAAGRKLWVAALEF